MRVSICCILFILIKTVNLFSQTLLIDPQKEGGFELPGGLSANGWSVINSNINTWEVSSAANPYSGNQSAFISGNSGATYGYNINKVQSSHFYRDVFIPANHKAIQLKFQYKSVGEANFDRLLVYVASNTFVPIANLPASSNYTLEGVTLLFKDPTQINNYTEVSTFLPESFAGTTCRLLFTWQNDSTSASQTAPASVDDIYLYSEVLSPLNGVYTINNTLPTSSNLPLSGGNFNNFSDAIAYLNVHGVSGQVDFRVKAGLIFTESPQVITASGNVNQPIRFLKSGTGNNPRFVGKNGIGASDACFTLKGSDYVTFDGIDVENNSASVSNVEKMEYGYYLLNASDNNGAQYNTIKNCSVALDRTNGNSIGIFQNSSGVLSGITGINKMNTFDSVMIQNCFSGIVLYGNPTFPDDTCLVTNCVIGSSQPYDIGGGSSTVSCAGIWIRNQKNAIVAYNQIQNIATQTSLQGIFIENGYGITEVFNNRIRSIRNNSPSSTGIVSGIRANLPASTFGVHTIRIYNNFVSEISSAYAGGSSSARILRGINLQQGGGGHASSVMEVAYNSVNIDGSSAVNASSACLETATVSGPVFKILNNVLANFTSAQAGSAKHFCWKSSSSTSIGNVGSVSDYNDLYIHHATNGFIGNGSSTDFATLANWQSNFTQDAHSIHVNPFFVSSSNLHVSNPSLNAAASNQALVPYITKDIEGDSRTNPGDIGADEFIPLTIDVKPLAFAASSISGCYSANQPISVELINNTGVPLDLSVHSLTVSVSLSGASSQSVTVVLSDNSVNNNQPIAAFSSLQIPVGDMDLSFYGTYSLSCFTKLSGDQLESNDTLAKVVVTNTAPGVIPFQVDFTNYNSTNLSSLFSGWYEASGAIPSGTVSAWISASLVNTNAKFNLSSNNKHEWIIGPKIIPTSNAILSYKAAVTSAGSSAVGSMGADDKLYVLISTDCGLSFQKVDSVTASSGLTNVFSQFYVMLKNYAGQEIIPAFLATDGLLADGNCDLHLDDIACSKVASYDVSLMNVVSPIQKNCYTSTEPLAVSVKNTGPLSMNMELEPIQLIATISNGNASNTYSLSLDQGQLNSNEQATYTITTCDQLQKAGTYRFVIFSNVPSGDINPTNDTLRQTFYSQNPKVSFAETLHSICKRDSILLEPSVAVNGLGINDLPRFFSTDGPLSIPDNNQQGMYSSIQVQGVKGEAFQLAEVRIDSLIHPFDGDLVISLIAPNGSSVNLAVNNGITGANFIRTAFTNQATTSINDGLPPFTGFFLPKQSLSQLSGTSNGIWKLQIKDISQGDVGQLHRWSLVFKDTNTILSYQWLPSHLVKPSHEYTAKVSPLSSTNFSLLITDANGCQAIASNSVQVNAPLISLVNDTTICEGNSIVLNASSGASSYLWNTGNSTPTLMVNQAGTYSVTVTDGNHCSDMDSVRISISPYPVVSISAGSDTICFLDAPFSFSVSPLGGLLSGIGVQSDATFLPKIAGVGSHFIHYQYTNVYHCSSKDSISIEVLPSPTVSLSLQHKVVCLQAQAFALQEGLPSGGLFSGFGLENGNQFNPNLAGDGYHVLTYQYTNNNGCSNEARDSILVENCTEINSYHEPNLIIYPNPATDNLYIQGISEKAYVYIYDMAGKLIYKIQVDESSLIINVANFPSGVYLLKIINSENPPFLYKLFKN